MWAFGWLLAQIYTKADESADDKNGKLISGDIASNMVDITIKLQT